MKIDESYEKLFKDLKVRYRNRVKGKVACRSVIYYTMYSFEIDLNSDDDTVSISY